MVEENQENMMSLKAKDENISRRNPLKFKGIQPEQCLFTHHHGDTNMHGVEARLQRVEERGGETIDKNDCRQLIYTDGL